MCRYCASVMCIMIASLVLVTACSPASPTPTISVTQTPTGVSVPQHYTSHVLLRGVGRPDDLAFDAQGRLLFSDFYNGTVSRVSAGGSVTVLLRDLAGPEGLIALPDGTLIIAEQRTHRILSLAPGATTPTVLRVLPGAPSTAPCKHGVDGIALDPSNNTIIVPDSPTGVVYRMSLDGTRLTPLASGIVRPVGAAVDMHGNMYVADECGGALWLITAAGSTTRIGGFGMPDDIAFDAHGNILVTDLAPSIHALIRLNPTTGKRETLASEGFIEPQGLVVDEHDTIFVSDDSANIIIEYISSGLLKSRPSEGSRGRLSPCGVWGVPTTPLFSVLPVPLSVTQITHRRSFSTFEKP